MCTAEESHWEEFEVFLEDEHGNALGQVHASHKPDLLKGQNVTSAACVRDVFLESDERNNAPFKILPEWFEYNLMHGLEHFYIYTFEDTDPILIELFSPYIQQGLASRVHFQQQLVGTRQYFFLFIECKMYF